MLITDKEQLKRFYTDQRLWQGIPSIEVTPKGRIFVTFYGGGTREEFGNYSMVVCSEDGVTYSEPIVAAFQEGYRCFDPCLWIDPLGRLWFTWGIAPEDAVWGAICEDPDAEVLSWSQPFKIGHDVMMNKPIVLSTGEWMFPLAVWNYDVRTLAPEFDSLTPEKGSFVYKSSDNGKTFTKFGKADVERRHFDEHMVVELQDGRLWMLVRTRYGIGSSYSYDRGATWTKGVDSGLGGPSSRFHITRLRSGRLLLINHVNFTRRNNLMALLSEDDGKTWSKGLMLDSRNGVSYPDAKEADDGYIYITYDRDRGAYKKTMAEALGCAREILVAKVTEEDILCGQVKSEGGYLQRIVNKLGAYNGPVQNPYGEPCKFTDEELADFLLQNDNKEQAISRLFDIYPVPCFADYDGGLDGKLTQFMDSSRAECRKVMLEVIETVRNLSRLPAENPACQRMKEYVENHWQEEFQLSDMAAALCVSRFYMCHLFKREYGITVLEYRNTLRLMNAKKLLISTEEQIGKIAVDCGFGSASYFGELFMRAENMTPGDYRKLHK